MKSERTLHNEIHDDVSNGYRHRRVSHNGQLFELQVPRSRESNFYPTLLGVLKDQEDEARRVVFSLYSQGLTTESATNWGEEFEKLKERGVEQIDLFVCDGLSSIENSISNSFKGADIQLCTVHLKRNILNKIKPRGKEQMARELKEVFDPMKEIEPEQAHEEFKEMTALSPPYRGESATNR